MSERAAGGHSITGAFIFLLLGLFAVMSSILVLSGVSAYRGSTASADRTNERRILSAYVRGKVRSLDVEDAIGTEMVDGVPVLTLKEYYGEEYLTRLYVSDGMLREWFSEAENPFKIGDGDEIMPAQSMDVSLSPGLLHVSLTTADGEETIENDIALRCMAQTDAEAG